MDNSDIAKMLDEVADLLELEDASVFRVRAYRGASRIVGALASPVSSLPEKGPGALEELPGIGKDLAGKIREIAETGELAILHELKERTPETLIELLQIPGLGPKRAKAIYEGLGVSSLGELEQAAREGRLRTLKGVGPKLEKQILEGIAARALRGKRIPLSQAEAEIAPILDRLRAAPTVLALEVAGSFRRRKDTVGDIDILVVGDPSAGIGKRLVTYEAAEHTLADGDTKASVVLRSGLQVDLRVVPAVSIGAALHYFTGSKAHNIAVRTLGVRKKLKINEYGVFSGEERVSGESEADVFAAVGLPFIPPELREDRGEIDAAREGRLPVLVERVEMRGDLGVTVEDVSGDAIEHLAAGLRAAGLAWAVVHGPAEITQAGGSALRKRFLRALDKASGDGLELLSGGTATIRDDGSLEADEDALAELDVVRGEATGTDEKALTRKLVAAVKGARLGVLARPFGGGKPQSFDVEAVTKAARAKGVVFEIDARAERLPGADGYVRAVKDAGGRLGVASHAARPEELGRMRYGLDQARRGWCTAEDVVNTRSRDALAKLLER